MTEQEPKDFKEAFERMNTEHVEALNAATAAMSRAITEGEKADRFVAAANVVNVLRAAVRLDGLDIDNIVKRAKQTGERRYA